jgi:nicotinamide phosphoribosyltransferase
MQYVHDMYEVFFNTPMDVVNDRLVILLEAHYGGSAHKEHGKFIKDVLSLHKLAYLPIEFRCPDEGIRYPIGLPMFTLKNTVDGFGWLVNNLETLVSTLSWPMINTATSVDQFYQQAKCYGEQSTPKEVLDAWLPISNHLFEYRGMFGPEHAARSAACHAIPFIGSDTIPVIPFLQQYYNYNPQEDAPVCVSIRATEHADITRLLSEFRYRGITEDTECEVIKRLAETTTGMFSYVADSEDYYRTISEYALRNKDVILSRKVGANGLPAKWVWRPDSARLSPLEVICGLRVANTVYNLDGNNLDEVIHTAIADSCWEKPDVYEIDGIFYEVAVTYNTDGTVQGHNGYTEIDPLEVKGSLQILWEVFGGEVVDTLKGKMKLINSKVGLLYGEAISQSLQKDIYKRMIDLGFSVSNLVIGKGSYSNLAGNTRDSFYMSFKQTFSLAKIGGEIVNLEQQKIPLGDVSKKSARGLLMVDEDFNLHQGVDEETEKQGILTILYKNGIFHKSQSIFDIKENYFK